MPNDTTLRQTALQLALEIVDLCDHAKFCREGVSETTDHFLAAADRILAWLETPNPPTRLVMNVGPVTEQT